MMNTGELFFIKARYVVDGNCAEINIKSADNNMCNQSLNNVIGNYIIGGIKVKSESILDWDYTINDIIIENGKVNVNVTKNTATNGKLIAASYANNGAIVGVKVKDLILTSNTTDNIDTELDVEGAAYVSVFIWDDITSMKPISAQKSKTL